MIAGEKFKGRRIRRIADVPELNRRFSSGGEQVGLVWAKRSRHHLILVRQGADERRAPSVGQLPELDRRILARGSQESASRAEYDRIDSQMVAAKWRTKWSRESPIRDVPHDDRAIANARGEHAAVRVERHRVDLVMGASERPAGGCRVGRVDHIPPSHCLVVAACYNL